MDPLTQGALGAAASLAVARPKEARLAALVGFVGGVAADLDTLIQSGDDTLLYLDFHRGFTHALLFIPVGAALVAAILWLGLRKRLPARRLYLFSLLGYATHGLLDACTSYGTRLWWPFTDASVGWRLVSVVDPLFTVPLLVLVVLAVKQRRTSWAAVGLVWALVYMGGGYAQQQRADGAIAELAARRGHTRSMAIVKPTMGNLVLWRSVYEHDGRFYVDAAHVGFGTKVYEGERSIARLTAPPAPLGLPSGSRQADDVDRFIRFSQGYVAIDPETPDLIGDVRYCMLPTGLAPLWGLRLDPEHPEAHARFEELQGFPPGFKETFMGMLLGR